MILTRTSPNLKVNTGGVDLPKTDINSKLPDVKTPNFNQITNDIKKPLNNVTGDLAEKKGELTGDLREQKSKVTSEVSDKVSDIRSKGKDKMDDLNPTEKVNQLKSSSEVKKMKEGQTDLLKDVDKAKGYTQDAKNISKGEIDKVKTVKSDLEKKAAAQPELTSASKDLKMMEEQQKQMLAMKNKEEFKKQTLARAKTVVAEQFAAQQQKITSTVTKVGQYQTKLGTIHRQIKDLPSRPRRERRPPLIERFVPGVTVQVQKNANWMVDVTPGVRFRVRSIFSLGAGWNERIVFNNSFKFFSGERIFGPRAIAELSIKKGFWLKADVEKMNAFVPLIYNQPDQGARKWVWSYFGGFRKDFSVAPDLKGNVQFHVQPFRSTPPKPIPDEAQRSLRVRSPHPKGKICQGKIEIKIDQSLDHFHEKKMIVPGQR